MKNSDHIPCCGGPEAYCAFPTQSKPGSFPVTAGRLNKGLLDEPSLTTKILVTLERKQAIQIKAELKHKVPK